MQVKRNFHTGQDMGVKLLCILLLLSVKSGCGLPQMVYLFTNQTWNDAYDSTCSLIGLDLTGDIANNLDNINISTLETNDTAWIGAYAQRFWINFEGCYYGIYKHNDSGIALTSSGNPGKQCLRHCNHDRFFLTHDKCLCYSDAKDVYGGCIARKCSNPNYTYCGDGTAVNADNVLNYCMCQFNTEIKRSYISGDGNCLAVTYTPDEQFIATNCNKRYRPLCYDTSTHQGYLNSSPNDWSQALSDCYKHNKQFANRTTSWIGNHTGTYWVGSFAVTYKLWGHPPSTNDNCIAVNKTDNRPTPVVLPCDTLLPALCTNASVLSQTAALSSKYNSTGTSEYLPNVYDVSTTASSKSVNHSTHTNTSDVFNDTKDLVIGGETKSSVPVLVGSIVGSVVGVFVVVGVVLYLSRRVKSRKQPAIDISLPRPENRNASCHYVSGIDRTKLANSNSSVEYENTRIGITRGNDRYEGLGSKDSHYYSGLEDDGNAIYINSVVWHHHLELSKQQTRESDYCGLTQPSKVEHEYGQLDQPQAK